VAVVTVGVLVLVALSAFVYLLLAPPVTVESTAQSGVTVECTAATGMDDEQCVAWGDEVIAAGPPSFTFEMEDLARLELDRSAFGFGSSCEAAYLVSRTDEPIWREEVPCPPR
jgi:hypothetical protein